MNTHTVTIDGVDLELVKQQAQALHELIGKGIGYEDELLGAANLLDAISDLIELKGSPLMLEPEPVSHRDTPVLEDKTPFRTGYQVFELRPSDKVRDLPTYLQVCPQCPHVFSDKMDAYKAVRLLLNPLGMGERMTAEGKKYIVLPVEYLA